MTHTVRLPKGWATTTLGEIRVDHSKSIDPRKQPNRIFELYSIPSFADGYPEITKGSKIGSTKKTLIPGTVVVSKINPRINRVWVVSSHTEHQKIGSGEWIPFFPVDGIKPEYLAYYLRRNDFRDYLATRVSGVGGSLMRVKPSTLADYPLVLPSPQHQQRIVEAIESYLTRLDDAVASLDRVRQNLKRYRASVLKAAVEGRLVPTEAELARREGRDYEPASELLERILEERRKKWIENVAEKARAKAEEKARKAGKPWTHADNVKTLEKERVKAAKKYKEPATPDTSKLPDLPEGWCWATIAQLASAKPHSLTDGPFGSNLKTEHYTEAGPRVIRLQNIGDGQFINAEAHISDEHYEQLRKHATYPGDVVIASLGVELPKACLVPDRLGQAIVKADCLRLKPNARLVDRHYLMHALNSRPIRRRTEALVHGMGRPRIGLTLLRTIPVPLPPHAEQKRIANRIDTLLSITENMVQLLERQNLRTACLCQSILKCAFEGKLVEQDPNDLPASVLLERIKAEREAMQPRKRRRTNRQKKNEPAKHDKQLNLLGGSHK